MHKRKYSSKLLNVFAFASLSREYIQYHSYTLNNVMISLKYKIGSSKSIVHNIVPVQMDNLRCYCSQDNIYPEFFPFRISILIVRKTCITEA